MSINTQRDKMRVRLMFLNQTTRGLTKDRDNLWEKECQEFLTAIQEHFEDPKIVAYRHNGKTYPPSTKNLPRMSLMRRCVPMPEGMSEAFEQKVKFYEDDWEPLISEFQNYLRKLTQLCQNTGELLNALPEALHHAFDEAYFSPLDNAPGLTKPEAQDMMLKHKSILSRMAKYASLQVLL